VVTGSGESEAEGDGGFLCYFLCSGDWFWRKEADGCADLLCWLRDSGEGKAYDDAGLLCWFPGSEESEADGDGGFLCYFLRSEKKRAGGGSTPLLVSRFFFTVTRLLCWFRLLFVFSLILLNPSASLFFTLSSLCFFLCLVALSSSFCSLFPSLSFFFSSSPSFSLLLLLL
jgi:hypothetical protein